MIEPDMFGAPIAENDKTMLDNAFCITNDFEKLTLNSHRYIVIGRRGSGKSALFYRLKKYGADGAKVPVVCISPESTTLTSIRYCCEKLSTEYKRLRQISQIVWQYSLSAAISGKLFDHFKFRKHCTEESLIALAKEWNGNRSEDICENVLRKLRSETAQLSSLDYKESFMRLKESLNASHLQTKLAEVVTKLNTDVHILVDRLDEGWDDTSESIGFISGFLAAVDSMRQSCSEIKGYVFLRDNIFRSITIKDHEGPRLFEGSSLRLQWEEDALFSMICSRVKYRTKNHECSDHQAWNHVAAKEIENKKGFLKCIGLTLFRPRDVIMLLNQAVLDARKRKQDRLSYENVIHASREISESRMRDLMQEYLAVFPAIQLLVEGFRNGKKEYHRDEIREVLGVVASKNATPESLQDLALLPNISERVQALYRIGFIGVGAAIQGKYIFRHDGSLTDMDFEKEDVRFLVHPAYWAALGLGKDDDLHTAMNVQEIHDESEAKYSCDPYYRKRSIDSLLGRFEKIKTGKEDAAKFEEWVQATIQFLTAGFIDQLDLSPNKSNAARRDLVGTIVAGGGFWARVNKDYGVRQIAFEVKNYADLKPEDFQQVSSYLKDSYGRLAFIVSNRVKEGLSKAEYAQIREYWHEKKLIVIISADFLCRVLRKLRSPDRFNYTEEQLSRLLTFHERQVVHS